MLLLYLCFDCIGVMPPLGLASCCDIGCFNVVYVKLFVVRSVIRVLCLCVKLMSAGPMKGRLDFFFERMYDAFTKMNGRCV